ncbi:MAG: hypothetical protein V4738_05750 [Pseudomonadota bacterium]
MRATPLLCLVIACGTLQAQTSSQNTPKPASNLAAPLTKTEQPAPQGGPRVERIRVEDAGARVDEVRYGGVTQSITVQPAANVPGYEVLPNNTAQSKPGNSADTGSGQGPRVWKFFNF